MPRKTPIYQWMIKVAPPDLKEIENLSNFDLKFHLN